MKILKYSLLLILMLIFQDSVFAGRGNPIMVIELDCNEDGLIAGRQGINVREISRIEVDCDDMVELCPAGYEKREYNEEQCECIPDCVALFIDDCESCGPEDIYWIFDEFYNVGTCGCEGDGVIECGCPPWLTQLPYDVTVGFEPCDIVPQPCYNGEVMVLPFENDCDNLDINGMDTVDIIIMLDMRDPADPNTGYGYSVSIAQLQNCQLSNDQNFVIALAEQYGNEAAFVDDDNDGKIELQFLRDPTMETVIDFDNDNNPEADDIVIPACQLPAIPTLSTWMIIALGLIMAISGLLFVKRKEVRKVLGAFMLSF
jgi:hypothetical protein